MTKEETYTLLAPQVTALLSMESDPIANMANLSAVLFNGLPELNWAGFYRLQDGELVLGPFQGKPACVRIRLGKGVCGTAALSKKTQLVKNVHEFPGHIACDAASKSEIVIPLLKKGQVWGVLDIDSPLHGRFDETDQRFLEQFAQEFMQKTAL